MADSEKQADLEAIRTLHGQLDDDANGNIDLSESDEVRLFVSLSLFLRPLPSYASSDKLGVFVVDRNMSFHLELGFVQLDLAS